MVSDKEIKAAREAWREYWSDVIGQYEDNKGPMEGMRRALEAAARVRAEADAGEPVRKVVYEALRFANWAAGEGISPIDGEPASAPEDFLMDYSNATGDVDWEGLANRIYTRPTPSEARLREALANLVQEIDDLVSESEGVAGLHLNGDVAEWGDLLPGGPYERLTSLDDARAALKEASDE